MLRLCLHCEGGRANGLIICKVVLLYVNGNEGFVVVMRMMTDTTGVVGREVRVVYIVRYFYHYYRCLDFVWMGGNWV